MMSICSVKSYSLNKPIFPRLPLTKLAKKISKGPAAINFAKQAINKAFDLDIGQAMKFSSKLYAEVYKTQDSKKGISAYLEKRKPNFIGK